LQRESAVSNEPAATNASTEIRERAARLRRLASIRTKGGWAEDQILLSLAERLEYEASAVNAV